MRLKRQCERFVQDHAAAIAKARPELPASLNDRAADIWEPLLAIADLAGGEWPERARQAAEGLTLNAQEQSPINALLMDCFVLFGRAGAERMFSRELVAQLNGLGPRTWTHIRKGKEVTEIWLAARLRPYGIRPKTIWVEDRHAKGYVAEDFREVILRFLSKAEIQDLLDEWRKEPEGEPGSGPNAEEQREGRKITDRKMEA